MRETQTKLREMGASRLAARLQIAAVNQTVARDLDQVVTLATNLSEKAQTLQRDGQKRFLDAKKVTQDANATIKATILVREKMGALQSLLQEARLVDKRYRLNVLKDKSKAILDVLSEQELRDPALAASVKAFVTKFGPAFDGPDGVLTARATALQDSKAQAAFEEKTTRLSVMAEELAIKITEAVDPLELASAKANTAINQVTEITSRLNTVMAVSAGVSSQARAMQTLAWQLIAAHDERSADRIIEQISGIHHALEQSLEGLNGDLRGLNHTEDLADSARVSAALASAAKELTGANGVASTVKANLRLQTSADVLFAAALKTIKQIAADGSIRSRAAEGSQSRAVETIETLSTVTIVIVVAIGLIAALTGMIVGSRIRVSILAGEEQRNASFLAMRDIVDRVRSSSRRLHSVSHILHDTSEVVTHNVERVAAGAVEMNLSISKISSRVSAAAAVGAQSVALLADAARSVEGLRQAGCGIGDLTTTIDDIARKTTILSLNAAVEAARAGEAGLGFAVVAGEVRNLAIASSDSTKVIGESVEYMKSQVGSVIDLVSRITGHLVQIKTMQDEISGQVEQQSNSTARISSSIEETAVGCRGNASRPGVQALALEIADLAEDLEGLCSAKPNTSKSLGPKVSEVVYRKRRPHL
jgi:methyl-accepting chemotaxis protein